MGEYVYYILFVVKVIWISVTSQNYNSVGYIILYIIAASELDFGIFKSVEGVATYRH